jgi:EpsI family protein
MGCNEARPGTIADAEGRQFGGSRAKSMRKRRREGALMNLKYTATILAGLMCAVSVASIAARPSTKVRDPISLDAAVPKGFGEWIEVSDQAAQVVNPQIKQELDKLYSQLLTRTYVNRQGYRIMLSLAYGDDQRGGLQAHRPEVCYPGQGFKIVRTEDGALPTSFGNIEVRRLTTSLGARNEPVTYWLTVGDQVVNSRMDKRIAEIRLALTGQIPDGLLFRISSIDDDPARAFATQQKFAAEMMSSVPVKVRKQLSGLTVSESAS